MRLPFPCACRGNKKPTLSHGHLRPPETPRARGPGQLKENPGLTPYREKAIAKRQKWRALYLFPLPDGGKGHREGPKLASRIVRKGPLLSFFFGPGIVFSSTGRGKRLSRAFPGSLDIAFSLTGRGERKSRGTPNRAQNRSKRVALGGPRRPKLEF